MQKEADRSRTAVLLLAFGGPRSVDEVGLFLEKLLGRQPSPQHIEGLRRRYQAIGGASPLPDMTLHQARALQHELQQEGELVPVYCGMRYSRPFIAEALEEIAEDEISRLILISLSPYRSSFSSAGYYAEVKQIVAQREREMELIEADDWHAHPGLCAAWAARITETIGGMNETKDEIPVIFTAHSLPKDVASASPYEQQLEETIKGIIEITGPLRWHLAFQSRAGEKGEWLGPDPETILEDLINEGFQKALICPIGFINDHLETLYDLDIALKKWADEWGIEISRIPCLNDATELIEVLVQIVEESLPKQSKIR
jgi:ferrochelatase